jgi:hypothetical protein
MFTNDQKERDRVLAAVLRAQGDVCELPALEALEQLSRAVQTDAEEDIPFGAVLHEEAASSVSLRVGSVWEQFLIAYRRAEAALSRQPSTLFDNLDALGKIELGPDVAIIGVSSLGSRMLIEAKPRMHANKEDVYVLLTSRRAAEMQLAMKPVLPESLRLMMRVSASESVSRPQHLVFIEHHTEPVPSLDGKTLSWRQKFVDSIPCLTAEEVAAESGHGAKNTSATASRWKDQGKIFAVKFKGRQLYPAFQFEHGEPKPKLQKILAELPNDPTGWERAFFFSTPNGYLGQERPMDHLDEDSDKIVRIARRHSNPAEVF